MQKSKTRFQHNYNIENYQKTKFDGIAPLLHFVVVFEEEKTSKVVNGTVTADIPEDCTEEEKQEIENALEEGIANSLGQDPKDVKVTMDPERGESIYEISADDATSADKIQKTIKSDDFEKNVNKSIDENKSNLSQRIQDVPLQIKDGKQGKITDVNYYVF